MAVHRSADHCLIQVTVVVAGVLSGPIRVDTAAAADEERSRESGEAVLEEIVVTATRRATSIQAAPLSVTALTGAELRAIGARDIDDYFARVPGLNYVNDGWSHKSAIRGVSSGTSVEPRPLSALYLDDVPMMTLTGPPALGQIGGPHPEVYDLARVEILRGPQGTLFGTSALGGAIRMITNAPDPDAWSASVEGDLSSTSHGGDNYQLSGVVNLPLVRGEAAVRAVGFVREEAGFIDDTQRVIANVNSAETSGGRVVLLWRATPDLALTLSGHHQQRDTGGLSIADPDVGDYSQARYVAERNDETWELFNFSLDYDLQWAVLMSSTSYIDRQPAITIDETPFTELVLGLFNPSSNEFDDGIRDFVQELRLTSTASGRLSWLAGAYYQSEDRATYQNLRSPGFDALSGGLAASFGYPDTLAHTEARATQRQRALYGELSLDVAPGWRVTVAGRWFDFRESTSTLFDGLFFGGPVSNSESLEQDGVTAKAGIVYRPSEHTLLFLNAAEGFRPGGTNAIFTEEIVDLCNADLAALGLTQPPITFGSDSLWSYELGIKTRWPDWRLTANGTVYHIDWDAMQTSKSLPNCGITFIENAGSAESDGLELEVVWRPSEPLELTLGAVYVDARLAADVPNVLGEEGERIPTVPDWSLSAAADTQFALPAGMGFARIDYQYMDASWSDFDQSIRVRLPSRHLLSLRTGLRRGAWEVALFADNLLDERVVPYHFIVFGSGPRDSLMQPRTVGVRAQLNFSETGRDR
jgi:outer membrane receptor protein involved in Fe transport